MARNRKPRSVHEIVRRAYGRVAARPSSCCGASKSSCCDRSAYAPARLPVPEAELGLSCGNPVAFCHLKKGDVVLDLGSGAGKDVFLAAEKVGPKGRAIGVDMTPQMLSLARKNAVKFRRKTGLDNVEFRKGLIEKLPLDDNAIDAVISNCVINLSPNKPRVFREIHRVLKPRGKMVVSDIVLNRELPRAARNDENLLTACLAGALLRRDYLRAIRDAGFRKLEILSDHTYRASQAQGDPITSASAGALAGAAASITVLARK